MPTLDADRYPHIFDSVFAFAVADGNVKLLMRMRGISARSATTSTASGTMLSWTNAACATSAPIKDGLSPALLSPVGPATPPYSTSASPESGSTSSLSALSPCAS